LHCGCARNMVVLDGSGEAQLKIMPIASKTVCESWKELLACRAYSAALRADAGSSMGKIAGNVSIPFADQHT
jgi:hypothetical protein